MADQGGATTLVEEPIGPGAHEDKGEVVSDVWSTWFHEHIEKFPTLFSKAGGISAAVHHQELKGLESLQTLYSGSATPATTHASWATAGSGIIPSSGFALSLDKNVAEIEHDENEDDEDECLQCGSASHAPCTDCGSELCPEETEIYISQLGKTVCEDCARWCHSCNGAGAWQEMFYCDSCEGLFHHPDCWDSESSDYCGSCVGELGPWGDDGDSNGGGHVTVTPWESRGTYVLEDSPVSVNELAERLGEIDEGAGFDLHQRAWNLPSTKKVPLSQMAATYYTCLGVRDNLLAPMLSSPELSVYKEMAAKILDEIVSELDPIFCSYVDIAVGGELRHHQATGGRFLSNDRSVAWAGWKLIRDRVGSQALLDAAELFEDFTTEGNEDNGGFGGKPWATIARTLHARVTRVISPELFIDRVFNLQHNGGTVLNKMAWEAGAGWMTDEPSLETEFRVREGYRVRESLNNDTQALTSLYPYSLTAIENYVGPAHSQRHPAWGELAALSRRDARLLWSSYVRAANQARRVTRLPMASFLVKAPSFESAAIARFFSCGGVFSLPMYEAALAAFLERSLVSDEWTWAKHGLGNNWREDVQHPTVRRDHVRNSLSETVWRNLPTRRNKRELRCDPLFSFTEARKAIAHFFGYGPEAHAPRAEKFYNHIAVLYDVKTPEEVGL